MDPNLPGRPVRLLRWLHAPVPPEVVAEALRTPGQTGDPPALDSALAGGRLVEDQRGWLRVNPLVAVRREPALRAEARRLVECALAAHPSDIGLRVDLMALQDWERPETAVQSSALLWRARLSGRGDEFIGLIEAAGLLPVLLREVPEALLRLLIEEGYTAEARPFVSPDAALLSAAYALATGSIDELHALVQPAPRGQELAARLLQARGELMRFHPDRAWALLEGLDCRESSPEEAVELALVRHRVASHRFDLAASAAARAELERAVSRAEDGWLRPLLVEALIQECLRIGDLPRATLWLEQLEALVAAGWAPGLAETVHVLAGRLACLRGDHVALELALAQPVSSLRHQADRELQQAAALVLRGAPGVALRLGVVGRFGGLRAQLLAEHGRADEALDALDADQHGYLDATRAALRARVMLMLGDERLLGLPETPAPLPEGKIRLHNATVRLSRGELDAAERELAQAAAVAERAGLAELAAHVRYHEADLAARRGERSRAIALLEGIVASGLHPSSFLVNHAAAAHAVLEGRLLDGGFVDRLVRQEDAVGLALLSRIRTLPAEALALVTALPDALLGAVHRSFQEVAEVMHLTISPECRRVVLPGGRELDLRRSGPPRLVLLALVRARQRSPELPLDADALISAGWPGERILWQAARTRLYTVIRRLRAMGLEGIETIPGGYRLAPQWTVHEVSAPAEE